MTKKGVGEVDTRSATKCQEPRKHCGFIKVTVLAQSLRVVRYGESVSTRSGPPMISRTTMRRFLRGGMIALGLCGLGTTLADGAPIPLLITADVDPIFITGQAIDLFDINEPIKLAVTINSDAAPLPKSDSAFTYYSGDTISGCNVSSGSNNFGCFGNEIIVSNSIPNSPNRDLIYFSYFLDSVPEFQTIPEFQSFASFQIPKTSNLLPDTSLSSVIEAMDSPSYLSSLYSQLMVVFERGPGGFTKGVVSSQITNTEVGNTPPTANAGGPYVFDAHTLTVSLDGSGSEAANAPIEKLRWQQPDDTFLSKDESGAQTIDFGLNEQVPLTLAQSGLTAPTLHADGTRTDPGAPSQQVTLSVIDETGFINFDNADVDYQNTAPSVLSVRVNFDINEDYAKPFLERIYFDEIRIYDPDVGIFESYIESAELEFSISQEFGLGSFREYDVTPIGKSAFPDPPPLIPLLNAELSPVEFIQRFNSLPGDKTMWVNVKDRAGDIYSHEVNISLPSGVLVDPLKN